MHFFLVLLFPLCLFAQSGPQTPAPELEELTTQHILDREKSVVRKNGKIVRINLYDESHLRPSLKKFLDSLRKAVATKSKEALKPFLHSDVNCQHRHGEFPISGAELCYIFLRADNETFWMRLNQVLNEGGCFTGGKIYGTDQFVLPSIHNCFNESHIEPEMSDREDAGPFFFPQKIKLYEKLDLNSRYVETQPMDALYNRNFSEEICPPSESKRKCRLWRHYESDLGAKGFTMDQKIRRSGSESIFVEMRENKWQIVRIEFWSNWGI